MPKAPTTPFNSPPQGEFTSKHFGKGRVLSFALATLLSGTFATAQTEPGPRLSKAKVQVDFVKRERTAPPIIKEKLQALRNEIAAKKLSYTVGYTTAMDRPLEQLAGGRPPVDIQERAQKAEAIGQELFQADRVAKDAFVRKNPTFKFPIFRLTCAASNSAWDYRRTGKVTPIRDQGGCGSCWDFAAVAAFESSYLIRNNLSINASEQQILSCASVGSCGGSWYDGVFEYMITNGAAKETDYPYTGTDSACTGPVPMPYRAVARGSVHPEVPIPSVAQIKEALCEHGPLAAGVLATSGFQAYTGNVLDDPPVPLTVVGSDGKTYYNVNHCVTIVGWDDTKQAWLVKNSWGTDWGSTCGFGTERGYIWIKYGCDNIGLFPGWVLAKSRWWILDLDKFKLRYPLYKPFPPEELVPRKQIIEKVK